MIPARQAARLDVVATLTGRRGRPSPPLRIPVIGVLVALAGCAVCYVGATRTEPFLTVAGIAIAEVGLVTLTGALIALAARGAGRLPFAARFALRDAARQRSRTAPAVAAVMAAIAGSVAVGVYLQSGHADKQDSYLPAAELGTTDVTFSAVPGAKSPDGSVALTPLVDAATTSATVAAIQRVLPVQQVAVYQTVTYGQIGVSLLDDEGKQPLDLHDPEVYANYAGPFSGFFDDGSALQVRAGAQDPAAVSALRSGKVVIYDPRWWYSDGRVRVRVEQPASKGHARRVHTVKLPAVLLTSRPAVAFPIFPPSAAKALGVQISPVGVVASTTRVPSKHEQHALTQAVNNVQPASVSVERGYQGGFPIGLLALVVAAALVTLGGTFAAVGLAAAEGRTDVATLAAVGAGPFVRRRVAAAQAAVITVLAAPLGLITGLLAGWALVRLHGGTNWPSSDTFSDWRQAYFNGWPFAVPWPAVIALVVGVPMLAIVVAFVTTRSRLPLVRRLGQ
jgi:putative ABC transport system permease protein